MKLLVDNNLPPALARGLAEIMAGQDEVIHIRAKFGTGSLPDEAWIDRLGKEGGWSVLSGDRRIATRRPSRHAFLAAGLVGFFPAPAVMRLPIERKAARVLTLWPKLVAISASAGSGCFEIGVKGEKLHQIRA